MLHIFVDADACPVKQEVYRVFLQQPDNVIQAIRRRKDMAEE